MVWLLPEEQKEGPSTSCILSMFSAGGEAHRSEALGPTQKEPGLAPGPPPPPSSLAMPASSPTQVQSSWEDGQQPGPAPSQPLAGKARRGFDSYQGNKVLLVLVHTHTALFSQEFYFLSSCCSRGWAYARVGPGPRWASPPDWATSDAQAKFLQRPPQAQAQAHPRGSLMTLSQLKSL